VAKVWQFEVLDSRRREFNNGRGHHLAEGAGFYLRSTKRRFFRDRVQMARLSSVRRIRDDETGSSVAAAVGLGAAGALLLGGAGLIGGLLLGNRRGSEAIVAVTLDDGRAFIAAMPVEAARYLQAITGQWSDP
jgi:hypothetical protein